MTISHHQPRLIFALGIIATLLVAMVAVAIFLQPERTDIPAFGLLLGMPVVLATFGAWITSRTAWWRRFSSVAVALYVSYCVGGVLIWITVRITAQLMFISDHDATLAELIVGYATTIALVFGYFVTGGLRAGIDSLSRAAREVQRGNLSVRADDDGGDELAQLARTFNTMVGKLRDMREQEQRLESARRDWIAWVSHDLRTPLTSLRARTEALSDGVVSEPAEVSEYLGAMRRDVRGLSALVTDLFDLASIEAGGLRLDRMQCALTDIVSDTIESMRVVAGDKALELSGEVAADVDPVNISPQHIQRVLTNLVGNALAHTSAGSVRVRAWREGRDVCVSVADTGTGIAPEDQPRVFERFYRSEGARPRNTGGQPAGMGLGLAIARAFVEAHDGTIGLHSQPGQGTTFWFRLRG